jgi:hypothetical protein
LRGKAEGSVPGYLNVESALVLAGHEPFDGDSMLEHLLEFAWDDAARKFQ